MEQKKTSSLSDEQIAKRLDRCKEVVLKPIQKRYDDLIAGGASADPTKQPLIDKSKKMGDAVDWLIETVKIERMNTIVSQESLEKFKKDFRKDLEALMVQKKLTVTPEGRTEMVELFKRLK